MSRRHGVIVCSVLSGAVMLALASASPAVAAPLGVQVLASTLDRPVGAYSIPGDPTRLFILEKKGVIRVITNLQTSPTLLGTAFLNIDSLVVNPTSGGDERGLLGLAFHPNYLSNGYFWVYYINNSSDTQVARYRVSGDPMTSNVADAASGLVQLFVDQPETNHNGGCMQFGPDGYLYIGLGDGGGAGDAHGTIGNGQALNTLLGKLLRMDADGVDNVPGNADDFTVPPTNPYVGPGDPLDQIWAYGLRNPWRFSFDRLTGDLYLADVGQNAWEEVNYVRNAPWEDRNFGWRCLEGTANFNCNSGPNCNCTPNQPNLIYPVLVYSHSLGVSVTGGYVYRGNQIPGEYGNYFYGDYGSGRIWSFQIVNGAAVGNTLRMTFSALTSFGEDANGNLYLVNNTGTTNGTIRRIVPLCSSAADINADCSVNAVDAGILVTVLLGGDPGDPALVTRSNVDGMGGVDGDDIRAWVDAAF